MIVAQKPLFHSLVPGCVLFVFMSGICHGQSPPSYDKPVYTYYADLKLYSIIPSGGPETFRAYNGGGVSGIGGSTESGIRTDSQNLRVGIEGQSKDRRFIVKLTVKTLSKDSPKPGDEQSREIDLTDLKPEVIELAKDADGRIYRATIIPHVKEYPATKVFRAEEMHFDQWHLSGSILILNDQDYLGTLGASGGNLASVDVPGLAKVDFSLIPLKGSQPLGILHDGTITIRHEQTTLVIRDVRNGDLAETLKGGPYTVFIRWKPPSLTVEQYRDQVKLMVEQFKTRINDGDQSIPTAASAAFAELQRMAKSDRVFMIGTSIQTAQQKDIDESLLKTSGAKK